MDSVGNYAMFGGAIAGVDSITFMTLFSNFSGKSFAIELFICFMVICREKTCRERCNTWWWCVLF